MEFDVFKIEVFIPEENLDELITALQTIDAGHVGTYDTCMSITDVTSLYRRLPGSLNLMGSKIGDVVRVKEKKLEVRVKQPVLGKALNVIAKVHPYEYPIVNVIPLFN